LIEQSCIDLMGSTIDELFAVKYVEYALSLAGT
jgi:hypothetical protein